jgi:xylan 1,4-beta-xylosidase
MEEDGIAAKPYPQIQQLEKAGQLQTTGKVEKINVSGGTAQINITLPRQGVSLLKMNW